MTSIVMAGGGTAGHTSPLIATAEALQRLDPEVSITCVGTPKGLENRVIPAAGLTLELVDPVPLPRRIGPDLFSLPLRIGASVGQARRILQRTKADVVAGFGGYVSLPVYLAARTLGIPVVVHEQNAVPGLANKVAAVFARLVAVTFPGTPIRGARFVGMPVRSAIASLDRSRERLAARAVFDLPEDGFVVLVSGGSQGAASINRAIAGAKDALLAAGVSILHVLGPKNMTDDLVRVNDPATGARYVPVAYVDRMELAYAAADLMVGRAGAGTVAETATVGLPGVFVPLPHGNGEQAKNASSLVDAGGAVIVEDAALSADRLATEVLRVASDPAVTEAMSVAGRDLMPSDAAGALARSILDLARGRHVA